MSQDLRRLLLEGSESALALALDLLFVQAEVRGVEERDGAREVWLVGTWPAALLALEGVRVRELPITADLFTHTGRERDAATMVAPDLCVRPPWVSRPVGFTGFDLVVPRGGAFGSGEHASTRAALLALHRFWPRHLVDTLVDVGTGSGILALYGVTRGAALAFACDIEIDAARAATQLVPGLRAVCGSPRTLAVRADVVIANMTARELGAELVELVRLWRAHAEPPAGGVGAVLEQRRGLCVLSGLRGAAQVEECLAACGAGLGLPVPATIVVEEFTALAFA